MKKTNRIIALLIISSLILAAIPFKLFATSGGSGDYEFSMNIRNEGNFSSITATVNATQWDNDQDIFRSENGQYHITIDVEETDGNVPNLMYPGDMENITVSKHVDGTTHSFSIDYTMPAVGQGNFIDFRVEVLPPPSQPDPGNGGEPGGGEPHFDGNAYFAWVDSNGELCYHKFEGMQGGVETQNSQGEMIRSYITNYIHVSELTDQSGHNSNYVWDQEGPANWVLARDMEDEQGNVRTDADRYYVFGNERDNMGCQLNPCGGKRGENSMCSNGDRNFRATIYRDGYETVQFCASQDLYTYFPDFWDPVFYDDTIDVSGTTKENPAFYEAYLLEPTITFGTGVHSDADITSVKALDVNANAVTITKSGSEFVVKFNSNYYDRVVFELTDANGAKYYIMIARTALQIGDNLGPNSTVDPLLIANFYYPNTYTYNDFEVVATVYYKDGQVETKKANLKGYEDIAAGLQPVNTYTGNGGKGLYVSQYTVGFDDTVENVCFTIIKKGALDGESYGGTFSGSGKGINFDIERRNIIY